MKKALLFMLTIRRASSQSGCEVCAATGRCQMAFKQQPGQFCGSFFDQSHSTQRPCCCPIRSSCRVSFNQCACHVNGVNPSGYSNYNPSQSSSLHFPPIVLFILVCCCCVMCFKRRDPEISRQGFATSVPVATAVPSAPSYGATRDGDFETHVHHCHDSGNNNTGNAIASGLGGLAVGTILGDMLGSGRNANVPSYSAVGNRGGYDIAGDAGGGYDIAGDTGDSGFDISGDS